ncbi:MAG: hypothetical protein K8F24_00970 [Bacteroidales bacterium]|nr:hypothetical protein [Bacteroidales bacterium]
MKKFFLLSLLMAFFLVSNAQMIDRGQVLDYRLHKGFYLSMSVGPNFPNISDEVVNFMNLEYTGTGAQFDLKIGGAVQENLLLHATLVSNSVVGPKITSSGMSQNSSNDLSIGEAMIGAGMTYYFMPANIFVSGSAGLGNFTLIDNKNDINISTDRGFSFQLKAGKEWWVSRRWGLGLAVSYMKTMVTNKPGGGTEEKLNSNNFAIVFNATLN